MSSGLSMPHVDWFLADAGPLAHAAAQADAVAARWSQSLNATDRQALILGFYMAETLAGGAIEQALSQLPSGYHPGLKSQREDEDRHIGTFATWLGAPPEVPIPRPRQRQIIQWLVMLLVNELTGFCQFHMLARMLAEPDAIEAVNAIAADERVHIRRLLEWLEPLWKTRSALPVGDFIARFRRELPGRMCQFFPREELGALRDEMVRVIDTLLGHFPPANSAGETAFEPETSPTVAADGR